MPSNNFLTIATIALATTSLVTHAAKDPELQKLEKSLTEQLNTCRAEYKSDIAKYDERINSCKARYKYPTLIRDHCGTLIEQSQHTLNQKARACKEIKASLANAPKTIEKQKAERAKAEAAAIAEQNRITSFLSASSGKKFGPPLRCYQLGQSYREFANCSRNLGFSNNQISFKPDHPFGFAFLATELPDAAMIFGKSVVAIADPNTHTISLIELNGASFFGVDTIDRDFVQAYINKYNIPSISNGSYSNHEEGWKITFSANTVTIQTIKSRKDYKF